MLSETGHRNSLGGPAGFTVELFRADDIAAYVPFGCLADTFHNLLESAVDLGEIPSVLSPCVHSKA